MDICFVDVETTGLDPQKHTILEMALIKPSSAPITAWINLNDSERSHAESSAFKVNRYWQRLDDDHRRVVSHDEQFQSEMMEYSTDRVELTREICQYTDHCVLAGNNVKFDQAFLEAWLRRHGGCPTWDYHVVDIPTFCAGALLAGGFATLDPPFKSKGVSEALEVPEPEGDDKHTAEADARWSMAMWEKVRAL